MPLSRNQTHHIIMTAIYNELVAFNYGDPAFNRSAEEILKGLLEEEYETIDDYVKNTVLSSLSHYGDIVNAYIPYLRNWKWERLPLLTQAILLMSYAHFYYVEKVDKKVVINTAVDLAKKYIDDKQAKFINAILDKVLK